jgi:opacity protein-like surface antigen
MRKLLGRLKLLVLIILPTLNAYSLYAQGYNKTLTFQGFDHYLLHSAAGRSMGGISIGIKNDPGLMFQNPAAMQSIESIQVSLGGSYYSTESKQQQSFAPVRYYPNLSLLLESLTDQIPDPPPDTSQWAFGTLQDTVQRPFDDMKPDWSRLKNDNLPLQVTLAVPVRFGNIKFVAGLGAVKYADLNYYYQNNNVLSPDILSQRPLPTNRPTDDNPLEVNWIQSMRSRSGFIQGYGFSLAGSLEDYNLTVGFGGLFLEGSSDDFEQEISRGNLTFYSNAFRIDSVYSRITKTGTSDFSGQEFTLSSIIESQHVNFGFSLKLPTTITRKYEMSLSNDTTGTASLSSFDGEDKLELPLRGTIGLSFKPKENLTLGIEYEFRPYESVKYINSKSTETSFWLSASLFRAGLEFKATPWLALRGGMRGQAEIFQSEGNKLENEPVSYTVYSAGIGIIYSGLYLNIAYENSVMKYQDIWASAISKNSFRNHTLLANFSYEIPWKWN